MRSELLEHNSSTWSLTQPIHRRQLFCRAGDALLTIAAGGLVVTMAGMAAAASSGQSAAALTRRGMDMFKKVRGLLCFPLAKSVQHESLRCAGQAGRLASAV